MACLALVFVLLGGVLLPVGAQAASASPCPSQTVLRECPVGGVKAMMNALAGLDLPCPAKAIAAVSPLWFVGACETRMAFPLGAERRQGVSSDRDDPPPRV